VTIQELKGIKERKEIIMAFIRYHKIMSSEVSLVSITPQGRIIFHKLSVETYKIHSFQYGILFYDPPHKRLGIQLTNDDKEMGAYKFYHREELSSITNGRFFDYFNIRPQRSATYYVRYDKINNMLIVPLRKTYQGKGNRVLS
jgi:hypothetical protein